MKKKLLVALLTVWAAMTFTFLLLRMMPGDGLHDLSESIQRAQGVSYEQARIMAKTLINYDPDQPVLKQYLIYVGGLLHGNLGMSLTYRIPVTTIVLSALPWTLFIASLSTCCSFLLGTTLGLWAASRRNSLLDPLLTFYSTLSQAVPDFLLGVILLAVFGVHLQWLPLRGAYGPEVDPGFSLAFLGQLVSHALLPVAAFSLSDWCRVTLL